MNSLLLLLAQAPATPAAPASLFDSSGGTMMLLAVVGLSFYFLILRPQNKQESDRKTRVEKLAKGDRVITIGGIHGEVHDAMPGRPTVVLQVDKNTRLTFNKSAVSQVNPEAEPAKTKEDERKPA